MNDLIKIGRYRHYKGNEYEVLCIAKHSETLEPMVVYKALYGEGAVWVRPLYMWNETVTVDGVEVIGNEIKLADITLESDQSEFAVVRYGYGNNGDGKEGAISNNVIYTSCLGPLLVRNPALAMNFLKRGARVAGLDVTEDQFVLPSDFIFHEEKCLEGARKFITDKINNK